jgi:hypothetical protein
MKSGCWGAVVAMAVVGACSGSSAENAEPLVVEATTTTMTRDEGVDDPADEAVDGSVDDPGGSELADMVAVESVENEGSAPPDADPADVDPAETDGDADSGEAAAGDEGPDDPGAGTDADVGDSGAAVDDSPNDSGDDAASSSGDDDDPGRAAPTSGGGGDSSSGQAGGSGSSNLSTAGSGTTVSGPNLVPDDDIQPSCGASLDNPCLPATNGHQPYEAVSMGEYQTNVVVPDGAILDIYFDQSRSLEQMKRLCREMGGVFHTRPNDGSPWGGWGYCAHVDYP